MGISVSLFLPMLWVLDGRATPLEHIPVVYGAQFESPFPLESDMRRESIDSTSYDCLVRIYTKGSASGHRGRETTASRIHAHPRSLPTTPSSSSSISHPLSVGIVIGVVGTLFFLGLVYIFRRIYRRKKLKSNHARPISIQLRPSAPREFRHLEHFTTQPGTPLSPTNTTASSLRVAHRRPDGSWAFTEALFDPERDLGPDPTFPPSPTTFPTSPVSDSSGTAFSYDDASSSKTGPPPYVSPTTPPPLPRHESDKRRGRPSRR